MVIMYCPIGIIMVAHIILLIIILPAIVAYQPFLYA